MAVFKSDTAGLCTLISSYGFVGLTKENGAYYLVMMGREAKNGSVFGDFDYEVPGIIHERIPVSNSRVRLKVAADFTDFRFRKE